MACVMNEVRLGYFNVPSSFDIIKHHYGQCTCLSWMMLHLTFNDTIERGSKLVQAQHFSGFPFSLWQHLLALNNTLVLILLHYSSPVGLCVFENKRKKNWRCKNKTQENILKTCCQMYQYLYEKLLELFCTMNFIYGEVYLRSWADKVLNFWSIFAMQLKMIFWFCIITFCCCSKNSANRSFHLH